MKKSPLVAFNRFREYTRDVSSTYSHSADEYFELLDSFLLNPERHGEHVRQISEAAGALKAFDAIPRFFRPGGWFMKLALRKSKFSSEFIQKLKALEEKLREDIEPGDFGIDILPSRIIDTPHEWLSSGKQIHLVQIKTGIWLRKGLEPKSVSLSFEIISNDDVSMLEAFPRTEFQDEGEYQIGITDEGKFLSSSEAGGSLEVGVKHKNFGFKAETGGSVSSDSSRSEKLSYEFRYAGKVLKILSSEFGKSAKWELMRTRDHLPIGGHSFYLSMLTPSLLTSIQVKCRLNIDIEKWGEFVVEQENAVELSQSAIQSMQPTTEASAN